VINANSNTRSSSEPHSPHQLLDPASGSWFRGGRSRSSKHGACPPRTDLHRAGDFRPRLVCGVVSFSARPHSAVRTRRNNGSKVRTTRGGRGARHRSECTRVAYQRNRLRVGVSHS